MKTFSFIYFVESGPDPWMTLVEVVTAMTKKKNNFQRWLEPYQECRKKILKSREMRGRVVS